MKALFLALSALLVLFTFVAATNEQDHQYMNSMRHQPCRNNYGAHVCTANDRKQDVCNYAITRYGCVCYTDGSCQSRSVNQCSLCKDSTVVSVYSGRNCRYSCPYHHL